MGVVCPLGHDVDTLWEGILSGRSGANRTTIFDASTFPTTFDAEVKGYDFRRHVRQPQLHEGCSRGSGFVIGATAQACRQAGIEVETAEPADGIDRTRMGIYLGAGEGSLDNDSFFDCIIAGWDAAATADGLAAEHPRGARQNDGRARSSNRNPTWRPATSPCSRAPGDPREAA